MLSSPSVWQVAREVWQVGVAVLALVLSVWASGHAILRKRDSRAAIAWVGFVWLVPLVGAVSYFIFGVNRIRRQAVSLRGDLDHFRAHAPEDGFPPDELHRHLPGHTGHLYAVARVVGAVVARPLLPGLWRTIGGLLPPGASVDLARSALFFDGARIAGPILVLVGWAALGAVLALALGGRITDPVDTEARAAAGAAV
jgi:hypothetical protein